MKAFTDINQSKKLVEILPIESADHHYVRKVCDYMGNAVDGEWSWPKYGNINSKYANYIVQNFTSYEKIPCWSLAALLNAIDFSTINLHYDNARTDWVASATIHDSTKHCTKYESTRALNPVDACYEMILKLKERNKL